MSVKINHVNAPPLTLKKPWNSWNKPISNDINTFEVK
jgi:hypothetical protein